ncbi:putative flavoprotein involved in K+ transport [Cutibacterium modestum 31N]|nr:putative flavoprotein involved in K+ transport [Cutibacterium modestum 31N]
MDLTGKTVAVVGIGVYSIQVTPTVATMADQLVVFQRTPAYVISCIDPPYCKIEKKRYRRHPGEMLRESDDPLSGRLRLSMALHASFQRCNSTSRDSR